MGYLEVGCVGGEVTRHPRRCGFHPRSSTLPTGGANLTVGGVEFDGVNDSQQLVNIATNRQVVDDLRPHKTLTIDHKRRSQGDTIAVLDPVGPANLVANIGGHGETDRSDATLVNRRVAPRKMGKLRVDRNADNLDIALLKGLDPVVEGDKGKRT